MNFLSREKGRHSNDTYFHGPLLQVLEILREYHANIGDERMTGMSDVVNMKEVLDDLQGFMDDYIHSSGTNGAVH